MKNKKKRKSAWLTFLKNKELLVMSIPAVVALAIFHYVPMVGVIIAFKDYKYADGIFGSKWVGFKWFEIFLKGDLFRISRNTVLYGLLFIVTSVVFGVLVAILLNELKSVIALKTYQTIMIIPFFMSWVIVGLIFYIFLDPVYGAANQFLKFLGMNEVLWYNDPRYWPYILTFAQLWKGVGMGSVIYFAALMGIDPTLYEAATIDGANKFARYRYIIIPELVPLITILSILSMKDLFRGDFGLFFNVPKDVGVLYPATDILDTYIYRGLRTGAIGLNAAAGLFQSIMGLLLILIANGIVKKINPDNALF